MWTNTEGVQQIQILSERPSPVGCLHTSTSDVHLRRDKKKEPNNRK